MDHETDIKWERLKAAFAEAAELLEAERGAYLSGLRLEGRTLVEELQVLLDAEREASGFLDEPVTIDGSLVSLPDGARIGKYEIVGEIGHGGMGIVYEARRSDGEFDQRVAIKLTSRALFSEELARRFLTERQILAGLEHPNIVRLIDGGVTESKIPYYVMEYVEGTPLVGYVAGKSIEERLKLFVQICAAVAYAHGKLVVHRDLKPSNILVTNEGQAKLLDFGIAKILDADETAQTLTQGAPLTPAYASPEQIRGDQVSTASDVFSLGVILFELLTEQKPTELYGVPTLQLPMAICETVPRRPSQTTKRDSQFASLGRRAQGDLDNIVLKAIRKEPESRYPSAAELSRDIQSYLDGRPVSATPESFRYRAAKFVRRNAYASAAVAILLILVLTGAAIAGWQAIVARRQQAIAEQRFAQVRKVANTLIFEYHDEIAKLDGSTALREKLVADAVTYLDAISAGTNDDPELIKELAIAHRKVADAQGKSFGANLGKLKDALGNYRKSVDLLDRALASNPGNDTLASELINSLAALTEGLMRTGDRSESMFNAKRAASLAESLQRTDDLPSLMRTLRMRRLIIDCEQSPAVRYAGISEILVAISNLQKRFPDDTTVLSYRRRNEGAAGNAAKWTGNDLEREGKPAEALEFYRKSSVHFGEALRLLDMEIAGQPMNPAIRRSLFVAHASVASISVLTGDLRASREHLQEARGYVRSLVVEGSNKEAALDEVGLLNTEHELAEAENRLDDAEAILAKGLARSLELSADDTKNVEIVMLAAHFSQKGIKLSEKRRDESRKKFYETKTAELEERIRTEFHWTQPMIFYF